MQDTIFALATPVGGAIAILRISGPQTKPVLEQVFTGTLKHRYMAYGYLVADGRRIDSVMAAYFQGPASYTGEDMGEVYVHGGQAVVSRVLELFAHKGLRQALPGEFTRRAFLNGKMDLSSAEAVQDLIAATARRGAASAMEQLQGGLRKRIEDLESRLLDALSGIDAAIDYPEELEEDVFCALPETISSLIGELDALIQEGRQNRVLREGAKVAILGLPNAGKSSLLNALLGEDRAIVTAQAGTTRDIVEGTCSMEGVAVRLLDTAGIREAKDLVEQIGVERALAAAQDADLVLLCLDGAGEAGPGEEALLTQTQHMPRIGVITKQDIASGQAAAALAASHQIPAYPVSALTRAGLSQLVQAIAAQVASGAGESALITNARHVEALEDARQALLAADPYAHDPDCLATDLRNALDALGRITGSTVEEAVIQRIFSRFCVGK